MRKKVTFPLLILSVGINVFLLVSRMSFNSSSKSVIYNSLLIEKYQEGQRFVLLNEGDYISKESDSYHGIVDFYGNIEVIMKLDGHYEYLAYDRDNNELYATSYAEVMKITDRGYEKTEESINMNTELCKTSVSFSKDSVQIQTQYLYDNDPRIEFTSDYGYHAEIRTESLGTFVPVSVAVK